MNQQPELTPKEIGKLLSAPFAEREVKFKPQAVKGNRAMALAYIDSRVIMDRLDEVVGFSNWQDKYRLLPDNSVMCRLSLRMGGSWISRTDVGSPSEQPDGGDRLKAAFSDALKRAAVKFGLGRYLYRLPQQWCEYDPTKRQFVSPPKLPAWARAKETPAANSTPTAAAAPVTTPTSTAPTTPAQPSPAEQKAPVNTMPKTGAELVERLRIHEKNLVTQQVCKPGQLLDHVRKTLVEAGHSADPTQWGAAEIALAVGAAKAYSSKPSPAQTGGLPRVTQDIILARLHKLELAWSSSEGKKRVSEALGRELAPHDHVSVLTQAEALLLIQSLESEISKKETQAANRAAKKEATKEAAGAKA